jgi:hypothetical protein
MGMALQYKPKDKQVRLIYTDGPDRVMPEHSGKVFAVIGPFDCFTDKADLQDALETLVRGYNVEPADTPTTDR